MRSPLVPDPAESRCQADGSSSTAISSAVPATSGLPIQELHWCCPLLATPAPRPLPLPPTAQRHLDLAHAVDAFSRPPGEGHAGADGSCDHPAREPRLGGGGDLLRPRCGGSALSHARSW